MNEILEQLKNLKLKIEQVFPVKGGDINDSYRIETFDNKYFLKLNTAQNFPELFTKEANGLKALSNTKLFNIPKVIKYGITDKDFQFLLLEWLDKTEPTAESWENFGRQLAKLHLNTNKEFGWKEDNYIAIIVQPNKFTSSWEEFYAKNRILPMIKLLFDKKLINSKEKKSAENLCNELKNIFPKENPALLHGDLWNGNVFCRSSGEITLIDPAIYYGHREMDLALASLFGGFDDRFLQTYNEIYPLESNFNNRKEIAQLFPLLVHAYLFGGYYIKNVKNILKKF